MRIVLASDNGGAQHLMAQLAPEGVIGDIAEPFSEVGEAARFSGPYDAVVLQVRSTLGAAANALRDLRARGVQCPVLVLADRASPEEERDALNLGADDVMTQPAVATLLAARLRALHRRALGHASPLLVCGNVTFDQAQRQVTVDGRRAVLTAREIQVLEMLMLRRNMVLSKEHFLNRLYGDGDCPDFRILDVFVCKLRRKMAAVGAAEIIRTAWGLGYVLEEPTAAAVQEARERFAAGEPRRRRAHLRQPEEIRPPEPARQAQDLRLTYA